MSEIEQTTADAGPQASAFALRKTVVMVGMMGAGKTAVGRALAQVLGVSFLDSDDEIESAANMTVPEIFARDGEAFFRRKEAQVIARLLGAAPCILSTGGGAFLSEENRANIAEHGVSVWLNADLETLWKRVSRRNHRPLLQRPDAKDVLSNLFDERQPIYELADLTVLSVDGPHSKTVTAIMKALETWTPQQ